MKRTLEFIKHPHPYVGLALRWIFSIMLLYAAYDKILFPLDFARAVENYQITGASFSRWIAIWLPYLELVVAVLLIAGIWLNAAALLNLVMMAVFLIAVGSAYARGLDINCGCFGDESSPVTAIKVLSNVVLLVISIYLFRILHRSAPVTPS